MNKMSVQAEVLYSNLSMEVVKYVPSSWNSTPKNVKEFHPINYVLVSYGQINEKDSYLLVMRIPSEKIVTLILVPAAVTSAVLGLTSRSPLYAKFGHIDGPIASSPAWRHVLAWYQHHSSKHTTYRQLRPLCDWNPHCLGIAPLV